LICEKWELPQGDVLATTSNWIETEQEKGRNGSRLDWGQWGKAKKLVEPLNISGSTFWLKA